MAVTMPGVTVTRERLIAAPPAAVFAALTDMDALARMVPRVSQIEVLEQGDDWARLAMRLGFGPFGGARAEGRVRWDSSSLIVFSAERPVRVETRWTIVPRGPGALVSGALQIDLSPMLGPLAALIPPESLAAVIGPELDATLAALERSTVVFAFS